MNSDDYLAAAAELIREAKRDNPGCRGPHAQLLLEGAAP